MNRNKISKMSADDIYKALENKVLDIQFQAALYESIHFSQIGQEVWAELGESHITNIHLLINNSLLSQISLEITKLFDERKDTISLHHLLQKVDEESKSELQGIYNNIKDNSKLKKIKDFRHQIVAHNASEKKTKGISQDDIDFITKEIRLFIEKLFRFFNPQMDISKNISSESRSYSEAYLKCLHDGLIKRRT